MGVTLTDVLLFGKAQSDDVDNATLVIYRRNILRWSALGGYLDIIVKGVAPLSLPDAIANSLSYVKAFGGTEQRNIPDGYIERQFIYMMDGSYIKVEDLPISAGYRVEFDFQTTTIGSTLKNYLGGRAVSAAGGGFRLSKLAAGGTTLNRVVLYGFESETEYYAPEQFQANTRYKYTYDNGVCTLESGGSVVSTKTFTVTDDTSTDWGINIYYSNGSWSSLSQTSDIYVYSLKVWNDQGELVMDLVPAVQKGTVPVVGFYDTVSGTFKTATAGTFAAGGEAVPTPTAPIDIVSNNGVLKARHQSGLPLGYQKVESLTFTSGAYIITDIYPNQDTEFIVDVKKDTDNLIWLFGARNYPSTTSPSVNKFSLQGISSSSNTLWFQFDNTTRVEYNSIAVTSSYEERLARHTLGIKNKQIWMDGSAVEWGSYGVPDWSNFTALNPLVIGGNYQQSGDILGSFSGDLYGATGLILCKRLSDNVSGVYNPTTGNFFPADGTGTITAGTAVSDPVEIYTDGTVETIGMIAGNIISDDIANANVNSAGKVVSSAKVLHIAPVVPGETYTCNSVGTIAYFTDIPVIGSVSYDGSRVNTTNPTFTVPNDPTIKYVAFSNDTATSYCVQGSVLYNGGTATAEMLLKVGTYTDQQEIIDGTVTRKVGIKVLDGTETGWTKLSGVNYVSLPKTAISNMVSGTDATCLSNNFVQVPHGSISLSEECFSVGASYVNFKKSGDPTAAQFKQWLADQYAAGTPVTVIYPLATPTTESVAGQALQVTDGDNTLEITQAGMDGLELEAEYQAAVSLTIQEVQDANLDPNVQVTIS